MKKRSDPEWVPTACAVRRLGLLGRHHLADHRPIGKDLCGDFARPVRNDDRQTGLQTAERLRVHQDRLTGRHSDRGEPIDLCARCCQVRGEPVGLQGDGDLVSVQLSDRGRARVVLSAEVVDLAIPAAEAAGAEDDRRGGHCDELHETHVVLRVEMKTASSMRRKEDDRTYQK